MIDHSHPWSERNLIQLLIFFFCLFQENGSAGGPVPSGPTDNVGSATLDNMNLEPFFSLAYETIISEIENKCRTLGISPGKH